METYTCKVCSAEFPDRDEYWKSQRVWKRGPAIPGYDPPFDSAKREKEHDPQDTVCEPCRTKLRHRFSRIGPCPGWFDLTLSNALSQWYDLGLATADAPDDEVLELLGWPLEVDERAYPYAKFYNRTAKRIDAALERVGKPVVFSTAGFYNPGGGPIGLGYGPFMVGTRSAVSETPIATELTYLDLTLWPDAVSGFDYYPDGRLIQPELTRS